jgi:hypothetical protein
MSRDYYFEEAALTLRDNEAWHEAMDNERLAKQNENTKYLLGRAVELKEAAEQQAERLAGALEQIASCICNVPGDTVDVARKALAALQDAPDQGERETCRWEIAPDGKAQHRGHGAVWSPENVRMWRYCPWCRRPIQLTARQNEEDR